MTEHPTIRCVDITCRGPSQCPYRAFALALAALAEIELDAPAPADTAPAADPPRPFKNAKGAR
jgi:hypothetical protein